MSYLLNKLESISFLFSHRQEISIGTLPFSLPSPSPSENRSVSASWLGSVVSNHRILQTLIKIINAGSLSPGGRGSIRGPARRRGDPSPRPPGSEAPSTVRYGSPASPTRTGARPGILLSCYTVGTVYFPKFTR
eukprot:755029-Hanusia_phi.AAC.16